MLPHLFTRRTAPPTDKRQCRLSLAVTIIALASGFPLLSGCQSTGASPSTSSTPATLQTVSEQYQARRYATAFENARRIYDSASPTSRTREQAAYFAGLSAYHLDRYTDAEQYLKPLELSMSDIVAGNASATLGLIDMKSNRSAEAVVHFKRAYGKLDGPDRAESAFNCGLAYREMGQTTPARQQFLLARAASDDPDFRQKVQTYIDNTGWTVQLGAFTSYDNAERRVDEFESMRVARNEYGPAQIVEQRDSAGRSLYLVQVGNFIDYQQAVRARDRITGPAMIMTIDPDARARFAGGN